MRGSVLEVVIYKVSWKSVHGSRSCGGRKSPSPIDKAHGLYNSLYYGTSRDVLNAVYYAQYINLQIQNETLKQELSEKQELLKKASWVSDFDIPL